MDIFGIGTPELVFILMIALILFGPRRVAEIAAGLGKVVRSVRRMTGDFMAAWQREVGAMTDMEELQQARQELERARQELRHVQQNIITERPETRQPLSASSSADKDLSTAAPVPETALPIITQKEKE